MAIVINQKKGYDEEVAGYFRQIMPHAALVVDTETSGSDKRRHGLLSVGAISLHDPGKNFYGVCHLKDGAVISQVDIAKNEFGWQSNITQIINPHGEYPSLRDEREPFLEPNDESDYDLKRYMALERLIKTILDNGVQGKGFITTTEGELVGSLYDWAQDSRYPLPLLQYMNDQPSIVPIGHNLSFDTGFLNDAFDRAGLGSLRAKEIKFKEGTKSYTIRRPFSFAYRGNLDTGQLVLNHIASMYMQGRGEEVELFWRDSVTNTGQGILVPALQAQPGLTLDACMEYVGLTPRANTFSGKPHNALHDATVTLEVAARILTGRGYLDEFKNEPIGYMLR